MSSSVIVPLYKVKKCSNVKRGWKKYAGIVVERVSKVTCGLIDDEQDCFRGRRGCVDLDYPKTLR